MVSRDSDSDDPPPPNFRDKLNRLFVDHIGPNGKAYTNAEIVARVNASGKARITEAYLSLLRHGKSPEPRLSVVEALANAFGVPATYFLSDSLGTESAEGQLRLMAAEDPTIAGQVELLLALKQAGVTRVGARGAQFTEEGRLAFARLVETVGRLPESAVDAVLRVAEVMADNAPHQRDNDSER